MEICSYCGGTHACTAVEVPPGTVLRVAVDTSCRESSCSSGIQRPSKENGRTRTEEILTSSYVPSQISGRSVRIRDTFA